MKVLIVDDEPLILRGLVITISEVAPNGTDIREASNAYEALEMMKKFMPDVTITDLHMPEKNGFELIEEARQEGYCDRFIILTGYDEFEYVRQALRSGVVDYLLKPLDKEEITNLLIRIKDELPVTSDAEYSRHVDRLLAYLHSNFRQDLSLDHLAEQMMLHPNYISSLFKKETGDTFVNFLNGLRIREAQKLLRTKPHLTVAAIGEQVGFHDKHYFTKVFKKYTGMTPSLYREEEQMKRSGADETC